MSVIVFGGESDLAPAIVSYFAKSETVAHCLSKTECDVRDLGLVRRMVDYHKPDVLINLAGVSHIQPIVHSNTEQWREEIEINLIGSYNVGVVAAEKGIVVIFIGSVAGKYGKANHSGYCASKAGVISLTQSLAMEGHKAYCISPGRIDTKMRERDFPGEDPKTRLEPQQIADIVAEIVEGKHQPGDNLIIRKKGYNTWRMKDKGWPWKGYLNVR